MTGARPNSARRQSCSSSTPAKREIGLREAYHPAVGNDVVVVLIIVLIIVLIWRGPKTLPEIGRMFGRGVREARAEAAKLRPDDDTPKDTDSPAT